jgi:hypothetical protein
MIGLARCKSALEDCTAGTFPRNSPAKPAAWSSIRLRLACLLPLLFTAAWAQAQFAVQPVGVPSNEMQIQITATVAGTVSRLEVLTLGSANRDFAAGVGPSTCAIASLPVGGQCTQPVVFTPVAPGLRMGAVVLVGTVDGTNKVLGITYLSGTGTGASVAPVAGHMIRVAGQTGLDVSLGDGLPATQAELDLPGGVALDGAGNIYIADTGHNRIRMVCGPSATPTIQGTTCAGAGIVSTIAGDGNPAYTGDGGPASNAEVDNPSFVALDGAGNLYIADTGNNALRIIDAVTGAISTVAGNLNGAVCRSASDAVGDGCPASEAALNQPRGVTLDASGNIYIADTGNNVVRVVNAVTHTISIVAGSFNGTVCGGSSDAVGDGCPAGAAQLDHPYAVAFDPGGNMYIPDAANHRIREIEATGGVVSAQSRIVTFAGTGILGAPSCAPTSALASESQLSSPSGVAVDAAGNVYIAETGNAAIRKVGGPQSSTPGAISTLAQSGCLDVDPDTEVDADANGEFRNSKLHAPAGLALDGSGNLYVADTEAMVVEEMPGNLAVPESIAATTTTIASNLDPSGFGQSLTFTVTVSAPVGTGNLTGTVGISDTFGGTTTALASGLALNTSGAATFSVSTLAVGRHSITAAYNNLNDPAHAASTSPALVETVLEGTAVFLTSSTNPAAVGQSATFTATVTSSGGGVTPSGTVTFYDGATILGTPTLNASGVATYTTSSLANGMHQIVAVYSGSPSAEIEGSTSPVVYQQVQAPSSIAVSSSLNPSTYGVPVTFTATVTSTAAFPATGTVKLLDKGLPIATGTLAGNPGTATFTISTLAAGTHTITVTYAGDSYNQSSKSSAMPLDQIVTEAQTVTTVSATPVSGIAGTPETLTASVALTQGSAPLTGTVNFTSGTTLLGSAALNASGVAAVTLTLVAGTYEVVATYQGNANAIGSSSASLACSGSSQLTCSGGGPLLLAVAFAATQTALAVVPTTAAAASPIAFSATVTGNGVTPTGSVDFLANGVVIGTAPLNAGTAALTNSSLPAGSYAMTAEYLGNAYNATSTSAGVSESVTAIPTTTVLAAATTSGTDPQIALTATVTGSSSGPEPSGTVTFFSGATSLGAATLSPSGVATLSPTLIKGTNYNIDAVYGGDAFNGSSTSQTITVAGVAYGFTVTVSPATVSIPVLQKSTVTVTLTSIANFSDTVGMSCASLPAAVSCQFASVSLNLPAGGTVSTQLTIDTNNAQSSGTNASARIAGRGGFALAGFLLPFSFVFGSLFWRRPLPARLLAIALVLLATAWAASGCATLLQVTASPGNYVIQVVGTGTTSQVIRSQNLSIDITK